MISNPSRPKKAQGSGASGNSTSNNAADRTGIPRRARSGAFGTTSAGCCLPLGECITLATLMPAAIHHFELLSAAFVALVGLLTLACIPYDILISRNQNGRVDWRSHVADRGAEALSILSVFAAAIFAFM